MASKVGPELCPQVCRQVHRWLSHFREHVWAGWGNVDAAKHGFVFRHAKAPLMVFLAPLATSLPETRGLPLLFVGTWGGGDHIARASAVAKNVVRTKHVHRSSKILLLLSLLWPVIEVKRSLRWRGLGYSESGLKAS